MGSIIGFFAIRWQVRSQQKQEVLRLTANLITAGEEMREIYVYRRKGGMQPPRPEDYMAVINAKVDELYRIFRHLELVTKRPVAKRAKKFLNASRDFHSHAEKHFGSGTAPTETAVAASVQKWEFTKDALVMGVNGRWKPVPTDTDPRKNKEP